MNDEIRSCLRDRGEDTCEGEVGVRYSDLGTAIWECDHHREESLKVLDGIRERYPDSPFAPDWFDPLDAGERWDDDY